MTDTEKIRALAMRTVFALSDYRFAQKCGDEAEAEILSIAADRLWRKLMATIDAACAGAQGPLAEGHLFTLLEGCTEHLPKRLPPGWTAFARAVEQAHGIKGDSND